MYVLLDKILYVHKDFQSKYTKQIVPILGIEIYDKIRYFSNKIPILYRIKNWNSFIRNF